MKEQFTAKSLSIYITEAEKWNNKPLYEAILTLCHEKGLVATIVNRGLEGFGASARIYHTHSLSISKQAPLTLTIVGKEEQIAEIQPQLDQMILSGLITTSTVEVILYKKDQ